MAILARSSILRPQAFARARSFHTTLVARGDHGHYHVWCPPNRLL